jgi:hypothetical protein
MAAYPETWWLANTGLAGAGVKNMAIFDRHSKYSWLFAIWVIIGVVVAWGHGYIGVYVVKLAISALLALFLWPLVLVGISLHIH